MFFTTLLDDQDTSLVNNDHEPAPIAPSSISYSIYTSSHLEPELNYTTMVNSALNSATTPVENDTPSHRMYGQSMPYTYGKVDRTSSTRRVRFSPEPKEIAQLQNQRTKPLELRGARSILNADASEIYDHLTKWHQARTPAAGKLSREVEKWIADTIDAATTPFQVHMAQFMVDNIDGQAPKTSLFEESVEETNRLVESPMVEDRLAQLETILTGQAPVTEEEEPDADEYWVYSSQNQVYTRWRWRPSPEVALSVPSIVVTPPSEGEDEDLLDPKVPLQDSLFSTQLVVSFSEDVHNLLPDRCPRGLDLLRYKQLLPFEAVPPIDIQLEQGLSGDTHVPTGTNAVGCSKSCPFCWPEEEMEVLVQPPSISQSLGSGIRFEDDELIHPEPSSSLSGAQVETMQLAEQDIPAMTGTRDTTPEPADSTPGVVVVAVTEPEIPVEAPLPQDSPLSMTTPGSTSLSSIATTSHLGKRRRDGSRPIEDERSAPAPSTEAGMNDPNPRPTKRPRVAPKPRPNPNSRPNLRNEPCRTVMTRSRTADAEIIPLGVPPLDAIPLIATPSSSTSSISMASSSNLGKRRRDDISKSSTSVGNSSIENEPPLSAGVPSTSTVVGANLLTTVDSSADKPRPPKRSRMSSKQHPKSRSANSKDEPRQRIMTRSRTRLEAAQVSSNGSAPPLAESTNVSRVTTSSRNAGSR